MVSDATTFFLAFTAVFGGLAYYLWHLERVAHRLEQRLALLEQDPARARTDPGHTETEAEP